MAERTESYGAGLAELMNPEVAANPQPIYSMLPGARRCSASTASA